MSQTKSDHISESTIARIAGNIMSGMVGGADVRYGVAAPPVVALCVATARAIAAEVERTRPANHPAAETPAVAKTPATWRLVTHASGLTEAQCSCGWTLTAGSRHAVKLKAKAHWAALHVVPPTPPGAEPEPLA